jgi:glycopeptide antibiotics resistance protein
MNNHKNADRPDKKRTTRANNGSSQRLFSVPAGIFLLVILFFSDHWGSPYREVFLVGTSIAIALLLFILTADYMTCAMSQSFGIILSLTYYLQSAVTEGKKIGSVLTPVVVFHIGLIWFSGFLILVLLRLFSRGSWDTPQRRTSFRYAFHVSSIVFLFAYAALLTQLFIAQRTIDFDGVRSLNLIPFKGAFAIYWPHILAGEFGHDIFIQFFGNLLIFTPLGFYLGVYGKKIPKVIAFLLPMILSGTIEGTQYLFNMGKSDIDDFWMNVLGFWIGFLMYSLVGLIRRVVTGGREKNIC